MILVAGATGMLGGMIARSLLAQGEAVRILVRPGSSYADLVEAGAQPVLGDLKDAASLRRACSGVSAVVTTANAVGRSGSDTLQSVDRVGNAQLIDAAAGESVGRFVFVSSLGATPDSPNPLLRAKGQTESRLCESGMTWTILQPNLFMDIWIPMIVGRAALAHEPVTLVGQGLRRHSMVAAADVAAYAVAALRAEAANNARLFLGGAQPISWTDVVAAFETRLGRELVVRSVPPGEAVPGLPEQVVGLFSALETYDSPLDMTEVSATFGLPPTSLEQFVDEFLARAATSEQPSMS